MYNSLNVLPSKIFVVSDVLLFDNSLLLCHFELFQVIVWFEEFLVSLIHQHIYLTVVRCGDEIHIASSLIDLSIMIQDTSLVPWIKTGLPLSGRRYLHKFFRRL